jgi:S-(hydroxymethyl)glutathione dehydrogenase/alcohol dehydrogenase
MPMSLAAVLYQTGQPLVVEEIHVAEPRAGEVLVRMKAAGVCHSDLHVMKGDLPMPLPIVLGHEGAGIVEAVGPGVSSVSPGDAVWPIHQPGGSTRRFAIAGCLNQTAITVSSTTKALP